MKFLSVKALTTVEPSGLTYTLVDEGLSMANSWQRKPPSLPRAVQYQTASWKLCGGLASMAMACICEMVMKFRGSRLAGFVSKAFCRLMIKATGELDCLSNGGFNDNNM